MTFYLSYCARKVEGTHLNIGGRHDGQVSSRDAVGGCEDVFRGHEAAATDQSGSDALALQVHSIELIHQNSCHPGVFIGLELDNQFL